MAHGVVHHKILKYEYNKKHRQRCGYDDLIGNNVEAGQKHKNQQLIGEPS